MPKLLLGAVVLSLAVATATLVDAENRRVYPEIRGKVLDKQDDRPIEGAMVLAVYVARSRGDIITPSTQYFTRAATTASDGFFLIRTETGPNPQIDGMPDVEPFPISFIVSHHDYADAAIVGTDDSGDEPARNVVLRIDRWTAQQRASFRQRRLLCLYLPKESCRDLCKFVYGDGSECDSLLRGYGLDGGH